MISTNYNTKGSTEWRAIMRENSWFKPDTMEYWNSQIIWESLTPILNGEWLFLSLEDNFERSEQRYSVRKVSWDGDLSNIETLDFQFTNEEDIARDILNEYSFELGSC